MRQRHSRGLRLMRIAAGLVGAAFLAALSGPVGAADSESFFTHLHTDKAMANVTVSPGRAGPVEIVIQLETVDETPLTAKAASVTLSNGLSAAGRQTVEATRTGDDQWHVRTSMLTPGRWMLGLGISISDTNRVDIESPILIQ
jgi:hypothetical protein